MHLGLAATPEPPAPRIPDARASGTRLLLTLPHVCLLQGRDTVIATSTASGKSLCYNIPILEALVADPDATALYMFPTKALAQVSLALPFF